MCSLLFLLRLGGSLAESSWEHLWWQLPQFAKGKAAIGGALLLLSSS